MLRKIEEFLIATSVLAITLIMNVNVIMRYVFNSSWTPTEEVCLIFIVIVTFLGSAYATRIGMHLFASLIFDLPMVPARVKKFLAILISVVCAVLCAVLAFYATRFVQQNYVSGRTTPSLGIPFYVFYAILPVSFALMAWYNVRVVLANLRMDGYTLAAEQSEPGELDKGETSC